jgi:tetratricopeptide (TPR) repeat protein
MTARASLLLFALAVLLTHPVDAQSTRVDSVKNVYAGAAGRDKARAGLDLVWAQRVEGMLREGVQTSFEIIALCETNKWNDLAGNAWNRLANLYDDLGIYDSANWSAEKALKIHQVLKLEKDIASDYVVLGGVNYNRSQYVRALEYYLKALPVAEKLNDSKMVPQLYNNMGNIYKDLDNFSEAWEYRQKALAIYRKTNYKYGIAAILSNTGFDLMTMHDSVLAKLGYTHAQRKDTVIAYFRRAAALFTELKMPYGVAATLGNMGLYFNNVERYDTALVCEQSSLAMYKEIASKLDMASCYGDMSLIYRNMKNYPMSIKSGLAAEKLAFETGNRFALDQIYMNLYYSYKASGQTGQALNYHEKWKIMSDSLRGEDQRHAITVKALHYEFDKKAVADSTRNAEEKKVKDAEIRTQQLQLAQEQTQRYYLFAGIGLLMVFGAFMYNRFKVTQKQRNIIAQQKEETDRQKLVIEEKQKEILDSIYYARRIQRSLLPSERLISKKLRELYGRNRQ